MNSLSIDFENCYGIKKMSHTFDFTREHTHLIYAPNGMMKSSFAQTMKGLSGKTKRAKDRLHTDRPPKDDVLVDGVAINECQIFVADAEDKQFDSSNVFMNFLASTELKNRYDRIYQELNSKISSVFGKLGTISQSSDCRDEIQKTFFLPENSDNIFACFERLVNEISQTAYTNFGFKYNSVFDKKGNVAKFLSKHQENLQLYIQQYQDLLENSSVFRSANGHTFGTHQASELLKSVEDGNFFEVNHKIELQDGSLIETLDDLKKAFEDEKERILSDATLKSTFDKITKAVDSNVEVRDFKKVIVDNPDIVLELADYEGFRKKTWYGYLSDSNIKQDAIDFNAFYQVKKTELNDIIRLANQEQTSWKNIIDLYNDRFHVPFTVEIVNQADIILSQATAKLKFKYRDEDNHEIEEKREDLIDILSKGELRAFCILQLLFELEARKQSASDSLVVFDDIADSFDYQNKYAIIEYIHDLETQAPNIYMIVLTHNFDFYRSLGARLKLRQTSWMAVKKENGTIELGSGEYQGDLFGYMTQHPENDRIFISMIPFVRNLIEYTKGINDPDYGILTSCLHVKDNTVTITVSNIVSIINSFTKGRNFTRPDGQSQIYSLIMQTADDINNEQTIDEVKIENKIVLSIACRLKAEKYLKAQLNIAGLQDSDLATTRNQTIEWTKLFKTNCPNDVKKDVVERVNMMTPELIHLNSFMYEPLIDLSIFHLKKLYTDCSNL